MTCPRGMSLRDNTLKRTKTSSKSINASHHLPPRWWSHGAGGIIPSPRYEEIFEPMAGPANPGLTEQIREPKNMLQGLWRRHSDFQFENQRKTVHNYGKRLIRRWGKDRVEVVGHLQAAYDTDGKRRPNGAEQVVIEEMMAKKQRLNRMTENKPNEYPRTVLPASGGNVRRPIKSFAFRPGVRTTFGRGKLDHLRRLKPGDAKSTSVSRPVRAAEFLGQQYCHALILEFLLFLADTNRFAGASNGGPLLNLDHREDSINSNGLPAPVPMLADPKVCKVLLLFHLRQINNHHPQAEYGQQENAQVDPRPGLQALLLQAPTLLHHNHRKDRALNALNQLGSIQRKINGSSAAFSKGGNSKLDVPKHWSRALVPPRGASVPQPP
ncbi:pre-mRNA splicing factor prp17 [Culex quinquefasciatus]|uniref:Pre-mRNA splicing factor prp17 n=1 Tax=Culex quinquefasciatus TaxID=7176 RepID=B0WXZ9_CULQU|nr:pre-mRNA splicing factor prp17 [Culex quinquefasciatus]|eukprot:XP_001862271.1 pre-mRNA splicing factor prp17 [Culex quinquefasciatus]